MLNNFQGESGREIPEEIVYNNGLHEAAHALFYAVHSQQGLMCIDQSCFSQNFKGARIPRVLELAMAGTSDED